MRAVLAEDLFLLRDGLVRLLEAHDFEIAATAEDAPGARTRRTQPAEQLPAVVQISARQRRKGKAITDHSVPPGHRELVIPMQRLVGVSRACER